MKGSVQFYLFGGQIWQVFLRSIVHTPTVEWNVLRGELVGHKQFVQLVLIRRSMNSKYVSNYWVNTRCKYRFATFAAAFRFPALLLAFAFFPWAWRLYSFENWVTFFTSFTRLGWGRSMSFSWRGISCSTNKASSWSESEAKSIFMPFFKFDFRTFCCASAMLFVRLYWRFASLSAWKAQWSGWNLAFLPQ